MKKVIINNHILAHTKWNCKYHIVFAPKYRRKVFFLETVGSKRNTSTIVSMERGRDYRGRSMPGSYTYAGEHPAQNERFGFYGISQRQERTSDLPKVGEYEICIPKPRVLVQGILRRYRGEEHEGNKGIYRGSVKKGSRK